MDDPIAVLLGLIFGSFCNERSSSFGKLLVQSLKSPGLEWILTSALGGQPLGLLLCWIGTSLSFAAENLPQSLNRQYQTVPEKSPKIKNSLQFS